MPLLGKPISGPVLPLALISAPCAKMATSWEAGKHRGNQHFIGWVGMGGEGGSPRLSPEAGALTQFLFRC